MPADTSDYTPAFWEFAFDDLLDGMLWPYSAADEDPASADPPATNSGERSRAGARGIEGQSREFARICGERTEGLPQWPINRLVKIVRPTTREQWAALRDVRSAAAEAASVLKAACPLQVPRTTGERLEAMANRLRAMVQAIDLVRPPLKTMVRLLSDEQRARFDAVGLPQASGEQEDAAPGPGAEGIETAKVCNFLGGALSAQSIDRLERALQPTDAQRGMLDALRSATAKAMQTLVPACPAGLPPDPIKRLAAMRWRLGAMLDAIAAVRPAVQRLYGSLSEAQKAKLEGAGREAGNRPN